MNRSPHRSRGRFGRLVSRMRHLLADERGDAMQWVMGLAVAALIIIALLTFGETLVDQIRGFLDSLSSSPLNDGGAGGDGGGG